MANVKLNARSQRKNELCEVKREKGIKIKVADKPEFLRTRVTREAVFKYRLTGSLQQALDLIDKRMEEIPSMSERTRELQKAEVIRLVERYVHGVETSTIASPCSKLVSCCSKVIPFEGYDIEIAPDFVSVTDNVVTLEVFTTGRQIYSNSNRTSDRCVTNLRYNAAGLGLLLYGLEEAAKNGITDGKILIISDNLKTDADTAEFLPEWTTSSKATNGTKSCNRVWVDYQIKDGKLVKEAEIFGNFRTGLAEWEVGKPKEKCSADECKKCSYFELCTYAPKVALPEQEKAEVTERTCDITEEQALVIALRSGICVVDAGPGSGKTQSSALRILNLLEDGVEPEDICVLSFSNAAVESIQKRVLSLAETSEIPLGAEKIKIFSFNSLGNEIIQKHYTRFGFTKPPTLIDDVEAYRIVQDIILWDEPISLWDYKNPTLPKLNRNFKCGAVFGIKEMLDTMRYYKGEGHDLTNNMPDEFFAEFPLKLNEIETARKTLAAYEEAMIKANVIDYADQVIFARQLIDEDENEFLNMFSFKHIIVDEFQDSNDFQLEILKFMVATVEFESLMVVGDDAQAIYGFRGASPENLIHFEEKIGEEVKDLYLSVNHRSVKEIVDFSNGIIASPFNTSIKPKHMTSSRGSSGQLPAVRQFNSSANEIAFVVEEIDKLIKAGEKPSDIAVISFTRQKLKNFSKSLTDAGVLNQYDLAERLVNNSRVMAAISFSEFMENPTLSNKGLIIYLNEKLTGGLFKKDGSEINKMVEDEERKIIELWENASLEEQTTFYLDKIREIDDGSDSVYSAFVKLIEDKFKLNKKLYEVIDYVKSFAIYGGSQTAEKDCRYEAVNLVTAHSSKGKEWKHVFVSLTDFGEEREELQEKLRLMYVACTRAMTGLAVSCFVKDQNFNPFMEAANFALTHTRNS